MDLPDARWRARFRRRLWTWFRKNARDLPWRRTRDPYAVWVSEIMLQQTQVETVKAYFERFIGELPTVQALADADEQRVLRLWEGLGYYRRARQMYRAARVVVDQFDGRFPTNASALQKLPGIGRYTAGAIASIAFDEAAPILEANTIRLFARLLAYAGDTTSADGQRLLWSFAAEIIPRNEVGRFNQALMELGALICTPKSPNCNACPAMAICPTFLGGLQRQIPAAGRKMQFEEISEAAVILRRGKEVLLRRCGEQERWAGLWDFPRVATTNTAARQPADVAGKIARQIGVPVKLGRRLTTLKHGVTRYRITLSCYEGKCAPRGVKTNGKTLRWVPVDELSDLPLSTTGRKLAALVNDSQ